MTLKDVAAHEEIVRHHLEGGYEEIRFGKGQWVHGNSYKVDSIWVFHHPDGRISTYEFPLLRTEDGGKETTLAPCHGSYNEDSFRLHIAEYQIVFDAPQNLERFMDLWQ